MRLLVIAVVIGLLAALWQLAAERKAKRATHARLKKILTDANAADDARRSEFDALAALRDAEAEKQRRHVDRWIPRDRNNLAA